MPTPGNTQAERWSKYNLTRELWAIKHVENTGMKGLSDEQITAVVNNFVEAMGTAIFGDQGFETGEPPADEFEAKVYIRGLGEIGRRWHKGGKSVDGLDGRPRKIQQPGWHLYLKMDSSAKLRRPETTKPWPERLLVTTTATGLQTGGQAANDVVGYYDKIDSNVEGGYPTYVHEDKGGGAYGMNRLADPGIFDGWRVGGGAFGNGEDFFRGAGDTILGNYRFSEGGVLIATSVDVWIPGTEP